MRRSIYWLTYNYYLTKIWLQVTAIIPIVSWLSLDIPNIEVTSLWHLCWAHFKDYFVTNKWHEWHILDVITTSAWPRATNNFMTFFRHSCLVNVRKHSRYATMWQHHDLAYQNRTFTGLQLLLRVTSIAPTMGGLCVGAILTAMYDFIPFNCRNHLLTPSRFTDSMDLQMCRLYCTTRTSLVIRRSRNVQWVSVYGWIGIGT